MGKQSDFARRSANGGRPRSELGLPQHINTLLALHPNRRPEYALTGNSVLSQKRQIIAICPSPVREEVSPKFARFH